MQYIERREKDMTAEQKLRLELMRTIQAGRGHNLRDPAARFTFLRESGMYRLADFVLRRFKVEFRDPADAKTMWPEKDTEWPKGSQAAETQEAAEGATDASAEPQTESEAGSKPKPKKPAQGKKGADAEEEAKA